MSVKMSRRAFVSRAAPAAIGAGLIGSRALAAGAPASPGANNTIAVGLIGCGGRGRQLLGPFQRMPEVRIAALCDVHKGHLAETHRSTGGKAKTYTDYRRLLADKDIDAVIVATNGHWHVLPAIDACAAGKDVYLEKPVGTSIGEGRAAVTAARRYDRIVHVGTQQHSWEHYEEAVGIIRSGVLGEISDVHVFDLENFYPGFGAPPDGPAPPELDWDFWVGPSPEVPYNPNRYVRHYWFFDYGGAWQLDWAVHHYDIVHWAMGVSAPVAAMGMGSKFAFFKDNTEWPDTFNGACEYPPGPVAKKGFLMTYAFRGGCSQPTEKRYHGKVFYGTDGALALDRGGFEIFSQTRGGKKVIEDKRATSRPEHSAVTEHVKAFLECMRTRKRSPADIEVGHSASNPGHLMNISWRVGRRVRWDPESEQVIDDPGASAFVTKRYRKPWSLAS